VEVGAVYVAWRLDWRPVWRVRVDFEVRQDGGESPGKQAARQLEQAIAATGSARWPRVALRGGRLEVDLLVRAVDDMAAVYTGLSVVDVAVAQVPDVELGELLFRSAGPGRPASTEGRS